MKKEEKYTQEFKEMIIDLNIKEGRSIKSLTNEFNLGQGTLNYWLKQFNKECQANPQLKSETEYYRELVKLQKKMQELEKENLFLKKSAAFFAKGV